MASAQAPHLVELCLPGAPLCGFERKGVLESHVLGGRAFTQTALFKERCVCFPHFTYLFGYSLTSVWGDILYFGLSSHMTFPLTLRQLWSLRALSVGFVVPLTDPVTVGLCLCFSSSSLPQWDPSNSPCLFPAPGISAISPRRMLSEPRAGHWV